MIVIYALLLIVSLFLFLPIRIGILGRYEAEEGVFCGWVRFWSGLWGVKVVYGKGTTRVGPMVLGWMPWSLPVGSRQKEDVDTPEAGEGEEEEEAEEVAEGGPQSFRQKLAEGLFVAGRVRSYIRRLKAPVWRFLKRLLRGFRFRRFACRLIYGASDPATTGQVFGYAQAVSNVLGKRAQVNVGADFERERLEGEAEVEVAVYVYRLLWAVLCLIPHIAGAWIADVWTRWRRKRVAVEAGANL